MMAWLSFAVPVLTALGILVALGLPIALALRIRGFAIAIVTIPAAFAVVAVTSIMATALGLQWGILPALALTAILTAVLIALRRLLGRPPRLIGHPHRFWLPVASAGVGGLIIAVTLVLAMRNPAAVTQVHDMNFTYNLIRYVLDTGISSSFHQDLLTPGSPNFYPMLWHSFASLVAQLTGASVPLADNALTFVVVSVVWPVGAVALVRTILGPNILTTVLAGVLSAAFPNFPFHFLYVHPNLLGYALIPFAAVAILQLLDLGRSRTADSFTPTIRWLLLIGSAGSAALAHPNSISGILAWAIFPVVWSAVRAIRGGRSPMQKLSGIQLRPQPKRVLLAVLGLISFTILTALVWYFWQTGFPYNGGVTSIEAIWNVLGSQQSRGGTDWRLWTTSLLIVIGALAAWRLRSLRWLIGSAALLAVLYMFSSILTETAWVNFITSPWYHAPRRVSGLIVMAGFPLAVLAAARLTAIGEIGLRRIRAAYPFRSRALHVVWRHSALLVSTLLLVTIVLGNLKPMQVYLADEYFRADKGSALLTPNERTLMSRLSEDVPEGATLLTNPWSGASLAYALEGYPVLFPHTSPHPSAEMTATLQALKDGEPEACSLVDDFNVRYVLDFGPHMVKNNHPNAVPYAPIAELKNSALLTEIDHEGKHAVLYEITGCE